MQTMVGHLCDATGSNAEQLMFSYDTRTESALVSLIEELPSESGQELLQKLQDAAAESDLQWRGISEGYDIAGAASSAGGRHSRRITPSDGDLDAEHPTAPDRRGALGIQKMASTYVDTCLREGLRQELQAAGSWDADRRLIELSDKHVDHSWMWNLSKHHGPVLAENEFVEAVRVRLGAAGPSEPMPCSRCGGIYDTAGSHASCCSIAEATRGLHAVANLVHKASLGCDPSAEIEVPGFIPGTDLRPADVLTTTLGNGMTALDISIASPHAQQAGNDCTAATVQRKLAYYGPHLPHLQRFNIEYMPMVWSSHGRPHAHTLSVLRTLSKRLSQRRGVASEAE